MQEGKCCFKHLLCIQRPHWLQLLPGLPLIDAKEHTSHEPAASFCIFLLFEIPKLIIWFWLAALVCWDGIAVGITSAWDSVEFICNSASLLESPYNKSLDDKIASDNDGIRMGVSSYAPSYRPRSDEFEFGLKLYLRKLYFQVKKIKMLNFHFYAQVFRYAWKRKYNLRKYNLSTRKCALFFFYFFFLGRIWAQVDFSHGGFCALNYFKKIQSIPFLIN